MGAPRSRHLALRWAARSSLSASLRQIVIMVTVVAMAATAAAAPPEWAGGGKDDGSGGEKCHPKKGCASNDGGTSSTGDPTDEAPWIAITDPAALATVTDSVVVSGTAGDDLGVERVEVRIDDSGWNPASGAATWEAGVDLTGLLDGSHVIEARAVDTAGAVTSASVTVDVLVDGTTGELTDTKIPNPSLTDSLVGLGSGKIGSSGDATSMMYRAKWGHQPGLYFRDSGGSASLVGLPVPSVVLNEWWNATHVWTGEDVWVFGGDGPIVVRHYRLSGSPLPSSAELVSTSLLGDGDSRAADLIELASGALMGVWHQQGATGPGGLFMARLQAGATPQVTGPLQFMPTGSSVQAAAQHPVDGSVWVFNAPDAWSATGAVHLTETTSGMRVDWTDPYFFSEANDGDDGSDPENPYLAAVPDPATGTVAVAYQSRVRTYVTRDPLVIGSQPVVARVDEAGNKSFTRLPVYVERISQLGLSVEGTDTWLAYRPVDPADGSFDDLHVNVHRDGAWAGATLLGRQSDAYGYVHSAADRPAFGARLADGYLHFFR